MKEDASQYKFEGRQAIVPLHKARNAGVKSSSENANLPTAGKQGYVDLKVPVKFTYGRIQLSAQVIKQSKSDKGSFARALETERSGIVNDVSRQRNRMLAGFGQGTLAVVSAGAASQTQALNNPGGVAGSVNNLRFTPIGSVLSFTDPTGVTVRGVQTVLSVAEPNVTLDGSVTTTTNDLVSLGSADASADSSFNTEPMGLLGLVDSTTYVSSLFNVDRSQAANAFFRSIVLTSVGTLSPDFLNRAIDNTEEISGEVITDLICHYSVKREFIKLYEADRRFASGASAINGDVGNKSQKKDLTYSDYPIRVDKDFAYGTLIGLSKGHLFWLPLAEGEWADEDGSVLLRVNNIDAYEARYRVFENFFSDQGNTAFRLDGITATLSSGIYSL